MRVADYVIEKLVRVGIKHVFTVTGRGILYLTDAVAKNPNVESISVHHEQAGGFAAYAYAVKKNGMGSCLVSTGCGATNAITACLCAWQDDVPCIFISGQNKLTETTRYTKKNIRSYGQQEADIISIVKPITKYSVMIEKAEDIIPELDKAISIAKSGRKGPVWIDIPLDIQDGRINCDVSDFTYMCESLPQPDGNLVKETVRMLSEAERPVLLIGKSVSGVDTLDLLSGISSQMDLPIVFDTSAVDIFPDINYLSIGTIGALGGSRAGNFAIQNSDLVLSLGCRLNSMQVGEDPALFARKAKIIAVDNDNDELLKECANIDMRVFCDPYSFLSMLCQDSSRVEHCEWVETCLHWKSIFPKCEDNRRNGSKVDLYHLADAIGNLAEEGDTIVSDAGLEELVIPSVVCKKNGVRCIHPVSQGSMGFALPAAFGASVADGGRVIAVIGDGSIMMNLQELQTIVHHQSNIKIIVVNNDCYAVIRKRQHDLFRKRTVGTDESNGVSCPDFGKIASAFGFDYFRIESPDELNGKLSDLLECEGPAICEVMGIVDQSFLHNSFAINEDKKMVRRSLEDQSPFLDRETMKREMIIDYLG